MDWDDDRRFRGDDAMGVFRMLAGTAGALFAPVWLILAGVIAQLDPSLQAGAVVTPDGMIAIVEYTTWEKFWWGGVKAAFVVGVGGSVMVVVMMFGSLIGELRAARAARLLNAKVAAEDDGFADPVGLTVRRTELTAGEAPEPLTGDEQEGDPPTAEEPETETEDTPMAEPEPMPEPEPVTVGGDDDDVDRLFQ